MKEPWPFDQPPNCAAVSMRAIMEGSAPVLLVTHDADDHGWQFLSGGVPHVNEAVLVTLESVVATDESLYSIADLPPGWYAVRTSRDAPWSRGQSAEGSAVDEL
jgi:hypothetical protein